MTGTASALIKVGGSLVGGLLGRKKKDTSGGVPNYELIRQRAEAAGFNPLTALRSGGFGPAEGSPPNLLSAQAVKDAANIVGDFIDPVRKEREKLERDLLDLEKQRLQASLVSAFGGVPTYAAAGAGGAMLSRPALVSSDPGFEDVPRKFTFGTGEYRAPGGEPLVTERLPVEDVEKEHGEVGSTLESFRRFPEYADWAYRDALRRNETWARIAQGLGENARFWGRVVTGGSLRSHRFESEFAERRRKGREAFKEFWR